MKKTLLFLATLSLLCSCGDDKKTPGKTDTGKNDSADHATTAVPEAFPIPAGFTQSVRGRDTLYVLDSYDAIDSLLIDEDSHWSGYPDMDYDSTVQAQLVATAPNWKTVPVDTVLANMYRLADFSQMCDIPEIQLPAKFYYIDIEREEISVRPEGYQKLRDRRNEVIAYFKKKHNHFTVNELCYFVDLNAVEMLPDLLRLERKLRNIALLAKDGRVRDHKEMKDNPGWQNSATRMIGGSYTQLLATITALLRNERYMPLMQSDMEADFKTKVEKYAAENPNYPTADKIGKDERAYMYFDPVYKKAVGLHVTAEVPITRQSVEMIASWADDYIKVQLPSSVATADKRMSAWPLNR